MEPVCYALLFADKIITEHNGKKGLIGVFSQFNFPKFPAVAPPWFIYAALSNLEGKHEFAINLVRDTAQEVVLPIAGDIEVKDATKDAELVFPILNLVFKKPGLHTLTLNIDGFTIASRSMHISEVAMPQGPGGLPPGYPQGFPPFPQGPKSEPDGGGIN